LLLATGWRVMTVWECAVRGKGTGATEQVATRIAAWLGSRSTKAEVRGR
jgi:DNA mismatch endonuclease (patch repair protein)